MLWVFLPSFVVFFFKTQKSLSPAVFFQSALYKEINGVKLEKIYTNL